MINLYTWATPNGRKVAIMLEELGVPYAVHPVNLRKNEQFSAEFLAISPNNKIPAIVDDEAEGGPLTIFESGAILTYLAEKSGQFLAVSGHERYKALEWLHWQIGGLGPMFGQLSYFAIRAEQKCPEAIERFKQESERLLGVLERRLTATPYLAGEHYSIADMAAYPWTVSATSFMKDVLGEYLSTTPAIHDWLKRIAARPGVQRGMAVPNI
ncbi:glutathione S-transferase family protein [Methyloradius palustris]|uniref:Glutathione S-transferase n=1 Tax=Methyloradius palustris TaxID=2778876 RepID=A0A8D5G166_9PROT|nr:glutathione S-transferase N-terminal domain-containing protein [Methyloradius palustris]BCM24218.1 glutathione S-transferase [Methyloradius palustris]